MRSRTKNNLDEATVKKLFAAAKLENVTSIAPLGAGEFNAVYAVTADGVEYALKIAPTKGTGVLPYEEGMMAAEVYWYKRMREDTEIKVPEIYFYDDSLKLIPSVYFIMEKLDGVQPDQLEMSDEEKAGILDDMSRMTASMHKVKNDKFGYVQMGLYDDWYQAIRAMTVSLIDGAKRKGHGSKRGEKLLFYIDKYKNILKKADCRMVNFDIWMPNMIAKRVDGKINYWWIDPERCFWGDRMADFVCLQMGTTDLFQKTAALEAYNSVAEDKVEFNSEANIRYAVMLAYMGLLMEAEKYYRYTIFHAGWWRNVLAGKMLFDKVGFKILEEGIKDER